MGHCSFGLAFNMLLGKCCKQCLPPPHLKLHTVDRILFSCMYPLATLDISIKPMSELVVGGRNKG